MINKTLYIGISIFGVLLLGMFMWFANNRTPRIERPTPTIVGYRELVEKTDDYFVYRNCEYRLEKVCYDTIYNQKLSTIETPALQIHPVPNRINLNQIFDPEENVDWNYTEIDEDRIRYLDSIGVYWDEHYGCYRKHK